MASYLLHHRHEARECGVVFAAFKGHESPLRRQETLASCRSGGHAIWWTRVEADSAARADSFVPGQPLLSLALCPRPARRPSSVRCC